MSEVQGQVYFLAAQRNTDYNSICPYNDPKYRLQIKKNEYKRTRKHWNTFHHLFLLQPIDCKPFFSSFTALTFLGFMFNHHFSSYLL